MNITKDKRAKFLREENDRVFLELEDGQVISWAKHELPANLSGSSELGIRLVSDTAEKEDRHALAISVLNELLTPSV